MAAAVEHQAGSEHPSMHHPFIHQSIYLSIVSLMVDGSTPLMSLWLQLQARGLSSPLSDALSICFPSFHPSSVPAVAH